MAEKRRFGLRGSNGMDSCICGITLDAAARAPGAGAMTELRPLAIGDWVKSNDPRDRHLPACKISRVLSGSVIISPRPGSSRTYFAVAMVHIHLDGKPRESGWSRVEPPE